MFQKNPTVIILLIHCFNNPQAKKKKHRVFLSVKVNIKIKDIIYKNKKYKKLLEKYH